MALTLIEQVLSVSITSPSLLFKICWNLVLPAKRDKTCACSCHQRLRITKSNVDFCFILFHLLHLAVMHFCCLGLLCYRTAYTLSYSSASPILLLSAPGRFFLIYFIFFFFFLWGCSSGIRLWSSFPPALTFLVMSSCLKPSLTICISTTSTHSVLYVQPRPLLNSIAIFWINKSVFLKQWVFVK